MAWVSTRKTQHVASMLKRCIVSAFLLHSVMVQVTKSLDEFSQQDLVVLEVPPLTLQGFENELLTLVNNITAVGPHIVVIVQPSLRYSPVYSPVRSACPR